MPDELSYILFPENTDADPGIIGHSVLKPLRKKVYLNDCNKNKEKKLVCLRDCQLRFATFNNLTLHVHIDKNI